MNIEKSGRVNQKKRTRAELLRTARRFIEDGSQPSVADVADAAGISRATAYRYFSTPEEMLREAVLDAVAETVKLPQDMAMSGEVHERLDVMVTQIFRMVCDNESVFRAFLSNTVNVEPQMERTGRRIAWLSEALQPLQEKLGSNAFDMLLNGLSILVGIEALVVLRDVCDLDAPEGEKVVRFAAQAILEKTIRESGI